MYSTRNDLPARLRGKLETLLNARLADALDLESASKQAHWNVKGANFIALHELFDQVHGNMEQHVDTIAERIAALSKAPPAVYASPLERTRETAAPIARALGLRVRTAPGLVEVDVGDWTEKPLARLYRNPEWPKVQRWPSGFRFPGGESFAEMSVRSMDTVLDLVAEHPGETIVAVSHADPIKAIVAAAAGMPLDLLQRLVISPCSISALLFTAGGPVVLCTNSTGSLNELALS